MMAAQFFGDQCKCCCSYYGYYIVVRIRTCGFGAFLTQEPFDIIKNYHTCCFWLQYISSVGTKNIVAAMSRKSDV